MASKPVLAVFGATGHQGGSVINHVLTTPSLFQKFSLRAITRDLTSSAALSLSSRGISLVPGDANDPPSLLTALTGVDTLFVMTAPAFGPDAFTIQFTAVKNIADAAVAAGVEYLIFSTLPDVADISKGKYKAVVPFDAKAKGEEYIRTLPIKSAFVSFGYFMDNFALQPFLAPKPKEDGTWELLRNASPTTKLPFIDAHADVGKFVGAILEEPERFEGKRLHAAAEVVTFEEIAGILSRTTGKTVRYRQVSEEEMRGMLPDFAADLFLDAFNFGDEFGYFGPGTDELVQEAKGVVRGTLTRLEEYLERNKLVLEGGEREWKVAGKQ
jgi:uncharacterized protein YbjT (DUF2867 family)